MKVKLFQWLEPAARIFLGGLFVYSAYGKIGDPGLFASMVMRYEILPECMVGLFSLTLPMLELVVGLALVFTKWMRESALLISALLSMFIAALVLAIARGLEIDCGCFGVPSVGGRTELLLAVARDVLLLVPAVWLMFRRNAWLGIRGAVILAAILAVLGLVAFYRSAPGEPAPSQTKVSEVKKTHGKRNSEAKARVRRSRRNMPLGQNDFQVIDDDDDELPPEAKAMIDSINEAVDNEDLAAVRSLAAKALESDNVDVRREMVEALGNFGVKTLPELTPFLADTDADVSEAAMNEWSVAVSSIDNEADKLGVVELAMHVLNDEDSLETISGEYIGADEQLAVESLLRIIEAGGSERGIAKAKETYEFVTGETFTDRAAAEKWIAEECEKEGTDHDN